MSDRLTLLSSLGLRFKILGGVWDRDLSFIIPIQHTFKNATEFILPFEVLLLVFEVPAKLVSDQLHDLMLG